jgi:hypothetical protein
MAIEAFFLAILVMVFILSNTHKCRDHVSYYDFGDYEQLRERERERERERVLLFILGLRLIMIFSLIFVRYVCPCQQHFFLSSPG